MTSRKAKLVALSIALSMVLSFLPISTAVSNTQPGVPASLAVSSTMKTLPADGASYPALVIYLKDSGGDVTVAPRNTLVYIISSVDAVGQVPPTVTVGAGESYTIANFNTTRSPGSTEITATATGLVSATMTLTTGTATGYPDQLRVTAVPSIAPAKADSQGSLIVELLDDSGLPAKAVEDTPITFYSSNPNVLEIPAEAVLPEGQFIMMVNYTTGFVPGSATITASAPGFSPGSVTVSVLGQSPLALKVYAQPARMITCAVAESAACQGRLVLALQDLNGNPVSAPREITVFIRSSNLSVVQVPLNDSVTINPGDISEVANFDSTSESGSATITVSSPNLASGFVAITTAAPKVPTNLKLYLGPETVLADHRSYSSVVVSLTNQTGGPAVSTDNVLVTLTSSVSATGNITEAFLNIQPGQNYGSTEITSTYQVGVTTITASAQNFMPDQGELSTYGSVPSKVSILSLSPQLPADGANHLAIEVMLEDSLGNPAIAPADIPVNVSSSRDGILDVDPTVIPAGQSYALVKASAGSLAGTANVTAIASFPAGLSISSTLVQTVIPSPSALSATVNAGSTFLTPLFRPTVFVQLQDSTGDPARAREPTNVTVTSSNSSVIPRTVDIQISQGSDFATLGLQPKTAGSTTLTVFSPGLAPSSVEVTISPYPIQEDVRATRQTLLSNETSLLTSDTLLDGVPLPGMRVSWNSSTGRLSPYNSTTDSEGMVQALFTPDGTGAVQIDASASNTTFGTVKSAVVIVVISSSAFHKSLIQSLTSFPLILAPLTGGGVAVFLVVLILRRKRNAGVRSDEEFEGFEPEAGQ